MNTYGRLLLVRATLFRKPLTTFFNLLFSVLLFSCITLTLAFQSSFNTYVNNSQKNCVDARTIFIQCKTEEGVKNAYEKLSKAENIVALYSQSGHYFMSGFSTFNDGKYMDGNIRLRGGDSRFMPQTTAGRAFGENETHVGIIPEKFYPSLAIESLSLSQKKDYIKGKDLIGQWVTVTYGEYDYSNFDEIKTVKTHSYSFKVVGVYNSQNAYCEDSICFVPIQDVVEVCNTSNGNLEEYADIPNVLIAVTDKAESAISVKNKVNDLGYSAEIAMQFNFDLSNLVSLLGQILSTILVMVCCLSLGLSANKNIKDRSGEIGLLKCIGYKNKDLQLLLLIETLIILLLAFFLSLIFSFVATWVFNNYIFINEIIFKLAPKSLLVELLLIVLLIPTIIISTLNSINKLPPIIVAKEESL